MHVRYEAGPTGFGLARRREQLKVDCAAVAALLISNCSCEYPAPGLEKRGGKRDEVGMCGRYRLIGFEDYGELNDVRITPRFTPKVRYNIAPTQKVAVVLDESPNEFSEVRWGLIPSWAKDAKIASSLINARCETVAEKPAFRSAFKKRRCLIPADGFYEWQKVGAGKQPYNIGLVSGEPFSFAGLWENWTNTEGEKVQTCTIITTTPNELTERIHNRMPVILPRLKAREWLDPERSIESLKTLLVPYPSAEMTAYPISTRVGSTRFDDPSIIEPLGPMTPIPAPEGNLAARETEVRNPE